MAVPHKPSLVVADLASCSRLVYQDDQSRSSIREPTPALLSRAFIVRTFVDVIAIVCCSCLQVTVLLGQDPRISAVLKPTLMHNDLLQHLHS